ncbi:sporulation protein [[Synechococcus] sp. NIES-970]|uniref:SpoIID/LytB domain-containing protein n=1 Tax=Picosynechococcus sp. NKBG15041c TaxID=1407650 RepID=UPI000467137B|nr:SpoIID/LytB domain-containing protein [Picosynechococcus sp. NKBG15041c]BAW97076.1 sporulation protein [[Synechococcus] sp. NIES-970]
MVRPLRRLIGHSWTLAGLIWLASLAPAPAQAAVNLRVAVRQTTANLQVGSSSNAVIRNGQGQVLGEIAGMSSFEVSRQGNQLAFDRWQASELWVEPKGDGYVWIGDRWYRGRTQLRASGNQILAINHVDLEEYLYSVVGAEAIPSWPQEALKAQAVAARTYALKKRAENAGRPFDLDTTTATQVYKGLNSEYSTTHAAVNATANQVMTYNGDVILAVFHSSSGGHTENVEDVWSQPLPYLRGVVDYDQSAPVYQWNKTISAAQLGQLVGGVGTVQQLVPQRATPQGRVVTMRIIGDRGTKDISGDQLRQLLELRSTLINARIQQGDVYIYGKGFGHGVGMSQWGANSLAAQGINYQQILRHYYQNATIARLTPR